MDIEQLLEKLSKMSPDDIAQYFMRLGIKGEHFPDICPLAIWLSDETGMTCWVLKYSAAVQSQLVVGLPCNVMQFVDNFDHGVYPALELT